MKTNPDEYAGNNSVISTTGNSHSMNFCKLLIILLFFSPGCSDDKSFDGEFTVLTYNVAGLPEGISGSHPELYTASISKLISDYNIVHVQEDFCYHDSLLLFDEHNYRTATTGCVPGGDGLNTFSDYGIYNLKRFAWTDCTGADCLTPKGFSYSQIEFTPGYVIDFYNVHANAGSSTESFAARRRNMAQICNYIQTNSAGNAVIVMGDFNSRFTREEDTIRAFLDLGFEDVWVKLICNDEVPAIDPNSLRSCDSVRTNADCERVDKILYRSNGVIKLTPAEYLLDDERFYYQGNDTLPLSDHWPVFATFKYEISE